LAGIGQNVRSGLDQINYAQSVVYGGTAILGGTNGTVPQNIAVLDLTWEKTKSTDIGLDYGFYNNRINGSFALYRKYVEGMLLESPVPGSVGISGNPAIWSNIGDMLNEGIEFDINSVNVNRKFKWSTSFNIAFNRNEIKKLNPSADLSGRGIINLQKMMISRAGQRRLVWYTANYAGVDPQT